MLGYLGIPIPDFLPYFNLLNHNTYLGFFLGAGGMSATWRGVKSYRGRGK